MDKLLVCIESFFGDDIDQLKKRIDNGKEGILCSAVEIQTESLFQASLVWINATFDLERMYNPSIWPSTYNPLVPSAKIQEEVTDGKSITILRGERAELYTYEEAVSQWGVMDLSRALGRYEQWQNTNDGRSKAPQNRACAFLRLSVGHSKAMLQVSRSIAESTVCQPHNREEWVTQQVRDGKSTDEAAILWNSLPESMRKSIDGKNYNVVANGGTFRQMQSRKVKNKQKPPQK